MGSDEGFRTVRGYLLLKGEDEELSPSMEDYLEMIYRICLEESCARVNHLAEMLNVQAPSVSRVLRKLTEKEYVKFHPYGTIQLTDKGKELGEYLLQRHRTVEEFLRILGVKDNLLIDTELIEHHVSADTLVRLEIINAFFQEQPGIMEKFECYRQQRLPR